MLTRRHLAFWLRILFLVGAAGALEILCRTGRIPRLTMIPPSEMAEHLAAGLWSGTYTADIAFTFANIGASTSPALPVEPYKSPVIGLNARPVIG